MSGIGRFVPRAGVTGIRSPLGGAIRRLRGKPSPIPVNRRERRRRDRAEYRTTRKPGRLLPPRKVTSRTPAGGSGPSEKSVARHEAARAQAALEGLLDTGRRF